jgi:iron complex outermembrane recepter protein
MHRSPTPSLSPAASTRSIRMRPLASAVRLALLAAAMPLAMLHGQAFAQTSTPAAPAAPAAEAPEQGKLETVTVTAERRSENIKDVPSSITAIRGETFDVINSGGQDIRMLAARVPSLNIESSFGRAFPRFYIRGLGNTDFDLNASQPVSLVLDDVVQENPILKGFPIFDIDQIEVLRGPQGTLYGRNTPAGIVKIDSAKPKLKKFEGYGNLSFGSFSTLNVEGAINAPLAPEWALRASAQLQRRDDWVKNTVSTAPSKELEGYNDRAARVQLLFQPSGDLSALGNVHYRKLDGSARLFRANILTKGSNEIVAGFDPKRISIDGVNSQELTQTGASLRVRYGLGDMALTSITGYEKVKSFSRGDIDGGFGAEFLGPNNSGPGRIPFAAESADGLPKHRQITQEFRLESIGKGPLKWIGGVYYFNESLDIDSFNYDSLTPGNPRNGYATQQQDNKAWALFGTVNYDVSDQLKLRGGLRYTNDKKDYVANRFQAPPFSSPDLGRVVKNTDASNVSGDISATYALDKNINLYARVATGFRAPSIQGRLLFPPSGINPKTGLPLTLDDAVTTGDSEKVTSFETGVKADLLDRKARVAFNVFRYQVKDQQLTVVGGLGNFNQLVNADKTIGQGFEVDLSAYVLDNLRVSLGGSYNYTKIKDPNLAVKVCGGGCTYTDPVVTPAANPFDTPSVSINNNALPQAPRAVVNFTARYGIPVAGGEMFVFTDWTYRSQINFFLYKSKEYTGKALTEGGLRVGYTWDNGKYEAAVFGRNITNQIRVVGGIDFNNLTGFINEPRTWGAQFKAVF